MQAAPAVRSLRYLFLLSFIDRRSYDLFLTSRTQSHLCDLKEREKKTDWPQPIRKYSDIRRDLRKTIREISWCAGFIHRKSTALILAGCRCGRKPCVMRSRNSIDLLEACLSHYLGKIFRSSRENKNALIITRAHTCVDKKFSFVEKTIVT